MRISVKVISLLILFSTSLFAQTERLSVLKNRVYNETGSNLYAALLALMEERNSIPVDSFKQYIQFVDSIAGDTISTNTKFLLNYYRAIVLQNSAAGPEVMNFCDSNISVLQKKEMVDQFLFRFLHLRAAQYVRMGQYKEAMKAYFDVLKKAEQQGNVEFIIAGRNGVGWVHMETENYKEAILWFYKAISAAGTTTNLGQYPVVPQNLAATYNSIDQNDSALKYIDLSIQLALSGENLRSIANGYAIKADILIDLNRKNEAAKLLKDALEVRKQIGDVFYILSDMYQLSVFYSTYGECEKGILICKEALQMAKDFKIKSKELILHEGLAENYKACSDMLSYSKELERIMQLKDSINKVVSADALAEMTAKYDLQKKEQQIVRQELLLSRRNYIIYGSLALFILIGVIGVQYFNHYRQRQGSMALIGMAKAREEERSRIAAELHDNIGTQLGFISRKIDMFRSGLNDAKMGSPIMLDEINIASRRTIADLRETIWTLKKEKVAFSQLADRLKVYAKKQLEDVEKAKLEIVEDILHDVTLSPVDSLNVFRIIQEAVYNAAVHSGANLVSMKFKALEKGEWSIEVHDNGIGFDTSLDYENHYGLENMKQRAAESGLKINIDSEKATGTVIILSFNDK